jgi:hypothetical protein
MVPHNIKACKGDTRRSVMRYTIPSSFCEERVIESSSSITALQPGMGVG